MVPASRGGLIPADILTVDSVANSDVRIVLDSVASQVPLIEGPANDGKRLPGLRVSGNIGLRITVLVLRRLLSIWRNRFRFGGDFLFCSLI